MMNPTPSFFEDLPLQGFGVGTLEEYVEVPEAHWWVALSDVRASTQAIAQGRYRDVNFIGASSAMALVNLDRAIQLPCVFGGDGAVVLIPASLVDRARAALGAARTVARDQFGLDLRCGVVPLSRVTSPGLPLRVRKTRISGNFCQYLFLGDVLSKAIRLLKQDPGYWVEPRSAEEADFSGLECRWESVKPVTGAVHLILVAPRDHHPVVEQLKSLSEFMEQVDQIYGRPEERHPLKENPHRLSGDPGVLDREIKLRAGTKGAIGKRLFRLLLRAQVWLGRLMMTRRLRLFGVDWGRYYDDVAKNVDSLKMDDVFRMVLAGNPEQLKRLRGWLEGARNDGRINFGTHSSPSSLLTCMVLDRVGAHTHFIDGNDGGFALAAIELKEQISAWRSDGRKSDKAHLPRGESESR